MATTHEEMKSAITDFLIAGPSELSLECVIEAISELKLEYESLQVRSSELKANLENVKCNAEYLEKYLGEGDVLEKYRHYARTKLKAQLLSVAASVEELQRNQDVSKLPSIIKNIVDSSPKSLSSNSKIFSLILAAVTSKKRELLADFHSKFESQLIRSEEFHQESITWGPFLESARGWIRAYTMVCILPSVLRDQDQVLEEYRDCLDSAFTPLWGRFHFHLTTARDSDSADQILWTFEYSKTFMSLLTELCAGITRRVGSNGHGDDGDVLDISAVISPTSTTQSSQFRTAGVMHILEKGCKFLRAHVAASMSVSSPYWSNSFAISLLEKCLELDHHLHSLLHAHQQDIHTVQDSTLQSPALLVTISSVFCDRGDTREMWLDFDTSYFRGAILASLVSRVHADQDLGGLLNSVSATPSSSRGIYGFYFDSLESSSEARGGEKLRCFKCVYDCLHLLRVAAERYRYLPPNMHDVFSCVILEPLFLSILALIFYRARTHPSLQVLRRRRYTALAGGCPLRTQEAVEVLDTCHYVRRTLQGASSFLPVLMCPSVSVPSRCERTWRHTMNWMTEVLKTGGSGGRVIVPTDDDVFCNLHPREIIEKLFLLCDKTADKISVSILPPDRTVPGLLSIRDITIQHINDLQLEVEGDLKLMYASQSSELNK